MSHALGPSGSIPAPQFKHFRHNGGLHGQDQFWCTPASDVLQLFSAVTEIKGSRSVRLRLCVEGVERAGLETRRRHVVERTVDDTAIAEIRTLVAPSQPLLPGCGERELNLDVSACAVWRGLMSLALVQCFILDPWKQHRVNLLAVSECRNSNLKCPNPCTEAQVIGLTDLTWLSREGLQSKHSGPQVLQWYRLSSDRVAWIQHPPLRADGQAIGINVHERAICGEAGELLRWSPRCTRPPMRSSSHMFVMKTSGVTEVHSRSALVST